MHDFALPIQWPFGTYAGRRKGLSIQVEGGLTLRAGSGRVGWSMEDCGRVGDRIELDGAIEATAVLGPGVYALVSKGVVIYVGQSKAVYRRVYEHRTTAQRKARGKAIPSWLPLKGFVFDQVFVWPCHPDALSATEDEKINLYKPKWNESRKTHAKVGPFTLNVRGVEVVVGARPAAPFERRI